MEELAISLFTQIAEIAVPFAVTFGICDLIVGTFLRVAFGGRLWFGR